MSKIRIYGVLAICLLAAFAPWGYAIARAHRRPPPVPPAVEFEHDFLIIATEDNNYHFTVEVARNEAQHERGLMERNTMPANHGMLFLWPEETDVNMWMSHTLFPLDMLFIDDDGQVVYIINKAEPNSLKILNPGKPVRAVLELLGGVAKMHDIHIGDHVIFTDFEI